METVGEKIRGLRIRDDITQEQLASALYVSKQTIYNWENDKSEPSLKNIEGLCHFFSVKADYFIDVSAQTENISTADSCEEKDSGVISDKVTKAKRTNKCKLLLLGACLSIIVFVILVFLTVIFGFTVFSTNKGGIDSFSTTPISSAEYGIIIFFAVLFLVLSVLFIVFYVKNRKHK